MVEHLLLFFAFIFVIRHGRILNCKERGGLKYGWA